MAVNGILLLSACGCRAADNASIKRKSAPLRGAAAAAAEGPINRRNTKNPLAQRLGFFVWSLSALGSKRGEQPLFHGSSALKSLVVFWFSFATKRERFRQKSFLQKAQNFKHAKMLCTENIFHIQKGCCTKWRSSPCFCNDKTENLKSELTLRPRPHPRPLRHHHPLSAYRRCRSGRC